jgi:hypothetical protein
MQTHLTLPLYPSILKKVSRAHLRRAPFGDGLCVLRQKGPRTVTPAPQNHEPTHEEWRELARQAIEEEDPDKALDLAQQVVEKYEEETRRKN